MARKIGAHAYVEASSQTNTNLNNGTFLPTHSLSY